MRWLRLNRTTVIYSSAVCSIAALLQIMVGR